MVHVLEQINKIQGVIGCFVCDGDGRLLGQALPLIYNEILVQEAAAIIADSVIGINDATGGGASFDLRFNIGRIIVRPIQNSYLLLLCKPKLNVPLLNISLNVVQKKLEKAIQTIYDQPKSDHKAKSAMSSPEPANTRELRLNDRGVVLTVDTIYAPSKIRWNQTEKEAAINNILALQLAAIFKTGPFKKIKLTNNDTKISKVLKIITYESDSGQFLNYTVGLTTAASEALAVKPGDTITAESATG